MAVGQIEAYRENSADQFRSRPVIRLLLGKMTQVLHFLLSFVIRTQQSHKFPVKFLRLSCFNIC